MRAAFFASALILTASLPAPDQEPDECRHEAQRSATLNAEGARLLTVGAGSGSLKITGKPGINQVIVRGRACASHADLLSSITLTANRRGDDVVVEANNRDRHNNNWDDDEYARLDVTIEVPARMAAEIADGSGSIDISNLGAVRIDDGSGDIVGNDLHGDLRIEDGSGSIRLIDVSGRVNIDDGSGGISLRNIGGAIDIDDSSGEISVRVARSSVRISDSSGDIDVVDVDGDFTVVDDSSGSIDHDNVRGRVDIPRRRR